MKRLLFLSALWIALITLAGLTWSVHDQSAYADRLDHYGLSESAEVLHTNSTMTPAQAAAKLANAGLSDVQVQFQTKTAKPVIYFYGTGTYAGLPVTSGAWFSDADLQSSLMTAVVGNGLNDALYTGSNQRYWLKDKQYVPVLGIVATRAASPLNQAVFLNARGASDGPAIRTLAVIADGDDLTHQLASLKHALGATSTSAYRYATTTSHSWWQEKGRTLVSFILLGLAALGLSLLASRLVPIAAAMGLPPVMANAYLRGWWGRILAQAAVATIIGVGVSWWAFYLTDRAYLLLVAAILLSVYAAGSYLGLHARFHREGSQ